MTNQEIKKHKKNLVKIIEGLNTQGNLHERLEHMVESIKNLKNWQGCLISNFYLPAYFVISSAVEKFQPLTLNLQNTPDLAQTIAVTCFSLDITCDLTGLHTLKIKETDRLVALKNELEKLGANVKITDKSLYLKALNKINRDIIIQTYDDHRMAMAFAPLALKVPIIIENADVITKSYVKFWKDLESVLV